MTTSLPRQVDPEILWRTIQHYPTGVVLITALSPTGQPTGMIVGSFTSVSLDPPLVAFLPNRNSARFEGIRQADTFCVNILAHDQGELCRRFAGKGGDDFAGVSWQRSPHGSPVVDGAVAWLDCSIESMVEGGDHWLVLSRVHDFGVVNQTAPLLYFQGGYGRFAPHSDITGADADLIAGALLAEQLRPDMQELAVDLSAEVTALTPVGTEDLAIVATVGGLGVGTREQIGRRIPLRPPLGEPYIAWQGPQAEQQWIARAVRADSVSALGYAKRLKVARERGWSWTLAGPETDALQDFLREYSNGGLIPNRARELDQAIAAVGQRYEPVTLDPAQTYDLAALIVPVLDESAQARLLLRVSQLPRPATGAVITEWVARIQDTTAAARRRLSLNPTTPTTTTPTT